jgi:DNA-binding beta-propeller fold protein YncE
MKKHRIALLVCLSWGMAGMAHAGGVTFQATDMPGSWFECANTGSTTSIGCVPASIAGAGQKSLAVIAPGDTVGFASTGQANTLHTSVSLIFPTAAANMPFDTGAPLTPPSMGGSGLPVTVQLTKPGLYVFFCDIHPYMFATVIVDDPATAGLDLGTTVDLPHVTAGGLTLPTASDLVLRLVHTFFVITNPDNWQIYPVSGTASWNPSYPPVPVLASSNGSTENVSVPNLNDFLHTYFGEPKMLSAPIPPTHPGVGQVWVDTQFEMIAEKTKPGTATAVNAQTFKVERKVGLPAINMNNPHNMWTDKNQTVIYQTQWFDNLLAVFDRRTGTYLNNIPVGPAPAHVMTRTTNDQVHVSQNAGNNVRELNSLAGGNGFIRDIPMGTGPDTHPHAHWMSAEGKMMVTPNEDLANSTLYDFTHGSIASTTPTGHSPIATGMMPDSSKYYVANFLDSTISVIGISGLPSAPSAHLIKNVNLIANYNALTGAVTPDPVTGVTFVGALPIQSPVSPDGRFMVSANTLTATITIIDTKTDTVVAMLPCDPGCHGVQFGAKQGGGYYVYVSSKLSNRLIVVDPDPNGAVRPNNGSNAIIAGHVLLTTANASSSGVHSDGTVSAYAGMGGQGVLPIPLVYNGWVQNLPEQWQEKLTDKQLHPIGGGDE